VNRSALDTTIASYPYLQGLWAIPLGIGMVVAGISNLQQVPTGIVLLGIVAGGLVLGLVVSLLISRHYKQHYGEITPTRSRQARNAIAMVAWVVVLFVAGSKHLFWSPDSPICVYAVAFALATLTYYAILVGLRIHHVVVWGAVVVAGLMPIWANLGPDRDPVAMMLLGVVLMLSGVLDQRLLAHSFGPALHSDFEHINVGR
jgi:drug/metabolite transporter (DMT)-like permease